jgi:hypothetical protein
MPASPADQVQTAIAEAPSRYFRLVLLTGPPGSGKTSVLQSLSQAQGSTLHNLNLLLTERLLELTRKQRALRVSRILDEELGKLGEEVVLLDNLEALFDPELQQDPLRLLQGLARNRTLVCSWPGTFDGRYLTYAEPGHPEWRRYDQPDAAIVPIGQNPG